MTTSTNEPGVDLQPAAPVQLASGELDQQIATARKYPRSVTTFIRQATELATMSPEIAASCIYALPRRENGVAKNVEGPSARFAEIVASSWGNLRAIGRVGDHDGQFITARGEAWDVEKNVAIAYEVRRRITDSRGRTYTADMIGVTGNAAASIALRNAILKAIPTTFWRPIYNACRKVIAGDQQTFGKRRDAALHEFAIMGVTEERILLTLGLKGRADITGDHLVQLAGLLTSLREGDTTIDEAFESPAVSAPQAGQRRSQQPSEPGATPGAGPSPDGNGVRNAFQPPLQNAFQPPLQNAHAVVRGSGSTDLSEPSGSSQPAPTVAESTTAAPTTAATTQNPPNISQIAKILESPDGAAVVVLASGFKAGTRTDEFIAAAKRLHASQAVVEVTTRPALRQGSLPSITEIGPVSA